MADAAASVLILLWLLAAAWHDVRRRAVPSPAWNAAPLLGAALLSAAEGRAAASAAVLLAPLLPRPIRPAAALAALADAKALIPALAASLFLEAWERGWWGGADACAALTLLLIFPDAAMLLSLAVGAALALAAFRLRGERRFPGLVGMLLAALLRIGAGLTGWRGWLS
jgi:Flp pilus assembly protein protease CpaA